MIVNMNELNDVFIKRKTYLIEGLRAEYTRDKARAYVTLVKLYMDEIEVVEGEIYSAIKESITKKLTSSLVDVSHSLELLTEYLVYDETFLGIEMNLVEEVEAYINASLDELKKIQGIVENLMATFSIQAV